MSAVREPRAVELFHHLPCGTRDVADRAPALQVSAGDGMTYAELESEIARVAGGLVAGGLRGGERVLLNLPKSIELVVALFAVTRAGGVGVPVHPNLPAPQLASIIEDCAPAVMISTSARVAQLRGGGCFAPHIRTLILCDRDEVPDRSGAVSWAALEGPAPVAGADPGSLALILYTSGSSGASKGVALSHENLVLGAKSVASYLGNDSDDRILAALPLSFDAGLSQVTTALLTGGTAVLLDYVFVADAVRAIERFEITGFTAVPSIWQALAWASWPESGGASLRYWANTGGRLHPTVVRRLRERFPGARPFLMYGLTEAFRSTYLPPEQADDRPGSIGKAVPNAEVFVLREDGSECDPWEHGEIVHVGPLVAQGYWNAGAGVYARFAEAPACSSIGGRAVWSGDIGYRDDEGYLYFVSRRDEMMKISGFRVAPAEVESAALTCDRVAEACAFAVEAAEGGSELHLAVTPAGATGSERDDSAALAKHMKTVVAGYAVPRRIHWLTALPRDLNGKVNRGMVKARVLGAQRGGG